MTIKMIHSCIIYRCTSSYDGIRHTSADETDTALCRSVYMSCSYCILAQLWKERFACIDAHISNSHTSSFLRALLYWIRYV